nr:MULTISPECIES: 2OG-Fe(II) oxygenase family protein [Protofrankia]
MPTSGRRRTATCARSPSPTPTRPSAWPAARWACTSASSACPPAASRTTSPPYTSFVVNDYPTWTYPDTASDEDKLLLLEHTDTSAVTILHQSGDYAGLQAQLPDGSWIPVPVVPGALQLFSGTILTRWTNGRLRPVRHRVVAGGTVTRRSIGIFYHPSLDTVLEPLPAFVGADGTDFEPVVLGELAENVVEDYMRTYGRPDQVAARREGRPYVSELAETSAGR